MKKLIIMGVFVFAFALTANVAFANCGCGFSWCCPETVVNNSNSAEVWNSVKTISNTGDNEIEGMWLGASAISTGAAVSAAEVQSQVGFNQTEIATPTVRTYVNNNNSVGLMSSVKTIAKTGDNEIEGGVVGINYVGTGTATSAASVINLVGQSVTKIGCASCSN